MTLLRMMLEIYRKKKKLYVLHTCLPRKADDASCRFALVSKVYLREKRRRQDLPSREAQNVAGALSLPHVILAESQI